MNCAETRRQLPAPDVLPEGLEEHDATALALQAHMDGCVPCRAELEGLREVDRRVQRLGAYVLLAMPTLLVQLARQVSQAVGGAGERARPRVLVDERRSTSLRGGDDAAGEAGTWLGRLIARALAAPRLSSARAADPRLSSMSGAAAPRLSTAPGRLLALAVLLLLALTLLRFALRR